MPERSHSQPAESGQRSLKGDFQVGTFKGELFPSESSHSSAKSHPDALTVSASEQTSVEQWERDLFNLPENPKPITAAEQAHKEQQDRVKELREWIRATGYKAEKVGDADPDYQKELDKLGEPEDAIFGSYIVEQIPKWEADDNERWRVSAALGSLRSRLTQITVDYPTGIGELVQSELEEALPGRHQPTDDLAETVATLSDAEFQVLLTHHVAATEKRMAALSPEVEQARNDFEARVLAASRAGNLPLDEATIHRRLARVKIKYFDVLQTPPHEDGEITGGSYHDDQLAVYLNLHADKGSWSIAHIVDHEFFHALSGRTPRTITYEGEEGSQVDNIRLGLSIGGGNVQTPRFTWLNEAVTESSTTELEGLSYVDTFEDTNIYLWEQALLAQLEQKVPREYFLKAYYENPDPNNPNAPSAWGELQRRLAEAYEPRILLTLDKIIAADAENGREQALDYLRDKFFPLPAATPESASSQPAQLSWFKRAVGKLKRKTAA